MRGSLILAVTLWAAVAAAEETPRREEPRVAILQALEAQASLPAALPELPEAASPVAESARETATEGARRGTGAHTRSASTEKARREASERASGLVERTPPGASLKAARSAALDAAGVGSEAQDAAGRSRAEAVRKNKEPRPEGPGSGRPTQPAPIRHP
jgi:ribonuclease E